MPAQNPMSFGRGSFMPTGQAYPWMDSLLPQNKPGTAMSKPSTFLKDLDSLSSSTTKSTGSSATKQAAVQLRAGKGSPGRGAGGKYWHIDDDARRVGHVYINPADFPPFGPHSSLSIHVNQKDRGRGLGREAYRQAAEQSGYDQVFAHMRKNNKASQRAAAAAGFTVVDDPKIRQLSMEWRREPSTKQADEFGMANNASKSIGGMNAFKAPKLQDTSWYKSQYKSQQPNTPQAPGVSPPPGATPPTPSGNGFDFGGMFGQAQNFFRDNPSATGMLYNAAPDFTKGIAQTTGGLGMMAIHNLITRGGQDFAKFLPGAQTS